MHVLLIEPPDPAAPVPLRDSAHGRGARFAPSWELLSLRNYLLSRTGYTCHYFDARMEVDVESAIAAHLASSPDLRLVVIRATSLGIGPAAMLIEMIHRARNGIRVAITGPHPSQFPEHSDALPGADFFACGDPEPIIRNLLDTLDVEPRRRRIPGLRERGQPTVTSYWLPDASTFLFPEWTGIFWNAYALPAPRQGAGATMRLSRGHTRADADRAHGGIREPLRIGSMERAAQTLAKCGSAGIIETHLADSPGFWTDARLDHWCAVLDRARNTQPWSLQLHPRPFSPDLIRNLQIAACRRIELLVPSTHPDPLARYNITVALPDLAASIATLQNAGIEIQVSFWLGGPEEPKGESDRIVKWLKALNFPPFTLRPFPLEFDSPLYDEVEAPGKPALDQWIRWAREPWTADRPVALWGGEKALAYIERTMTAVLRQIVHHPRRRWLRALDRLRHLRPLEWMENAALSRFQKRIPPPL